VKGYYAFLVKGFLGTALVAGGSFLIAEHQKTWGYLEFELLGHETYGAIAVLAGCCLGLWAMRSRPR